MNRVSAYPTVEWLRSRAADRPPVSPSDSLSERVSVRASGFRFSGRPLESANFRRTARRRARSGVVARRQFLQSLATELSRTVAPGTSVRTEQWVSTPNGEHSVDLVLRRGNRRLGLVIGGRYARDTRTLDALRLVYGGFDVLFRVTAIGADGSVADALHAFVREKPFWFTSAGRIEAGRRVSREALLGLTGGNPSVQSSYERDGVGPVRFRDGTKRIGIRRMRLSRANEWVEAFERALGASGRRVA